mgnify:CR=1 FL=1
MKLTDKVPSTAHRILIYGAPKSGKTQLVGELAKKYKLIWFDLENGYATLLKLPKAYQENIEIISIPDSKDFPIAIETLLKAITGNPVNICEHHGKVSCPICQKDNSPVTTIELGKLGTDSVVVIDSLTQLTNSIIGQVGKGKGIEFKFGYDEWAHVKNLVEAFLSKIQQVKYNIVCISHEEEVEMEDGKKKLVPVCGSSKSSRNTAKYFDHVVYVDVKNKKHGASSSTTFSNNILTGSRTDAILESAITPTLFDIFEQKKASNTPGQIALNSLSGVSKS